MQRKPAERMWRSYREEYLSGMNDASSAVCRGVFFAGMSMALTYFSHALRTGTEARFDAMMQALDQELSDEYETRDRTIN